MSEQRPSKTVSIRAEIREIRELGRALPSMALLEIAQRLEDISHPESAPPFHGDSEWCQCGDAIKDHVGQSHNHSPVPMQRAADETECIGWQPIETAPKDGSRILAYFDYNPIYRESSERWFVAVVRWTGDYGMWSMPGTGGLSPKLWQPIRYPNDPTLKANACQHLPGQAEWCPKCAPASEGEV